MLAIIWSMKLMPTSENRSKHGIITKLGREERASYLAKMTVRLQLR